MKTALIIITTVIVTLAACYAGYRAKRAFQAKWDYGCRRGAVDVRRCRNTCPVD